MAWAPIPTVTFASGSILQLGDGIGTLVLSNTPSLSGAISMDILKVGEPTLLVISLLRQRARAHVNGVLSENLPGARELALFRRATRAAQESGPDLAVRIPSQPYFKRRR